MEKTLVQRKQARQALEAMLGSDLFAHTLALSMAAVCLAETSDQPTSQHFTSVLRMAIVGELFEAGMSNEEALHWYETLMQRVSPFVTEIGTAMHVAATESITARGEAQ